MSTLLLPVEGGYVLGEFLSPRELRVSDRIETEGRSAAALSSDGVQLLVLDQDDKRLRWFGVERGCLVARPFALEVPPGIVAHDVAFVRGTPYVGGFSRTEAHPERRGVWSVRVDAAGLALENLPLPDELQGMSKPIDALLVDGGELWAVDDVVLPKYHLIYDIRGPPRAVELPLHATWEQIVRSALSPGWFVALSGGSGRAGSSLHLWALQRPGLEERYLWQRQGSKAQLPALTDLALVGNTLYLACGERGLGVVELVPHDGSRPKHPRLRFTRFDEPVTHVTAVPGERACAVTLAAARHRWVRG